MMQHILPHFTIFSQYRVNWPAVALGVLGALIGLGISFVIDWLAQALVPEAFDTASGRASDELGSDFFGFASTWLSSHDEQRSEQSVWLPAVALAIAGAALAAGCAMRFGLTRQGGFALGFCVVLLALCAIDLRHKLLPDLLTLPLLWAGLLVNLTHAFAPLPAAIVGAVVGYGLLWLLFLPARVLRMKEGIGLGDFKLYAAVGAWMGLGAMPQIFLLSLVMAAVVMFAARLLARDPAGGLHALGPFIVGAAAVTLFLGVHVEIPWLAAHPALLPAV
ncbi:prepilin peptidase [Burkholderia vietnamiensis]|uniref:prepilin peptidase n=1 Tax=Burkholderia vietnamiensis TaxID=60552 RepID=UPI001594A756|nr:A24 family peptidase [Burkholderia vietnamiensis]